MIILASQSQIRRKLLANAGIEFGIVNPEFDEDAAKKLLTDFAPEIVAQKLAEGKALAVSARHPHDLVIGADQVLSFEGAVIGKPGTIAEAASQLSALRGGTHFLHTAVSCCASGNSVWSHCQSARLTMRQWSEDFIASYVNRCGEDVLTTVGAYKIEGLGIQLFERIDGDYFTILGLPLIPLLEFLRARGELPK